MTTNRRAAEPGLADVLLSTISRPGGEDQVLRWLATSREGGDGARAESDVVRCLRRATEGLAAAKARLAALEEHQERFTAPPLRRAVFLGWNPALAADQPRRALVSENGRQLVVEVDDGVDQDTLRCGDAVLLGGPASAIVGRSSDGLGAGDAVAVFERRVPSGVLLRYRDEQILAIEAAGLSSEELHSGDLLAYDVENRIAKRRLSPDDGSGFFLSETPTESFEHIGGLDDQIALITDAIRLSWQHTDVAERYQLGARGGRLSFLLHGPPGTGKTLMARATANFIASLSNGGKSLFAAVTPGQLSSMWYGETEKHIRTMFQAARARSEELSAPAVLFFDELDSLGRARTASSSGEPGPHIDDRVLAAFLSELDGNVKDRGNVWLIGATNRPDCLDPALLRPGRFGDNLIYIPAPRLEGARAIFARHLSPGLAYAVTARESDAAVRQQIIDAAVSHIFASDPGNALACITFRDGSQRPIGGKDLVSGAIIANACALAKRRAAQRELAGLEPVGLHVTDILESIDEQFTSLAKQLTPMNCARFIGDLPQDLAIVKVTFSGPSAARTRSRRFLKLD